MLKLHIEWDETIWHNKYQLSATAAAAKFSFAILLTHGRGKFCIRNNGAPAELQPLNCIEYNPMNIPPYIMIIQNKRFSARRRDTRVYKRTYQVGRGIFMRTLISRFVRKYFWLIKKIIIILNNVHCWGKVFFIIISFFGDRITIMVNLNI